MGTSRQLSIGPEGVISLLTGAAVYVGFQDVQDSQTLYDYTIPRAAVLTFLFVLYTKSSDLNTVIVWAFLHWHWESFVLVFWII